MRAEQLVHVMPTRDKRVSAMGTSYPASVMAATTCSGVTSPLEARMVALSVDKLTLTWSTPGTLRIAFSTRLTHAAHVMPCTGTCSSVVELSCLGAGMSDSPCRRFVRPGAAAASGHSMRESRRAHRASETSYYTLWGYYVFIIWDRELHVKGRRTGAVV